MTKACGVVSVKGGVGKTLVSINLARALHERGESVALIDCDLDNSNFAQFTGASGSIGVDPKRGFVPYNWDGIEVFSMSLVAGRERGVSLTGDRYYQMIWDIAQSSWDTDYFVLDLPSGSGDVFRSAMDVFSDSLAGNVIVTQPSMIDASRRTLNLHRYFEIPVLGLIENMSYFRCGDHEHHPFGESIVERLAEEFGVEILGKIPLSEEVARGIAEGNPILRGELAEPIERACERLRQTPARKVGYFERLKRGLSEEVEAGMVKLIGFLVNSVNREIDIGGISRLTGLGEGRAFRLVITDESKTRAVSEMYLRATPGGIKVVKKPGRVDFEIHSDFRTLARMVLGKRRVGGRWVPFDHWDAWLNGDVRTYGRGYSYRAVHVLREIFANPEVMGPIRERYGKLLERWC